MAKVYFGLGSNKGDKAKNLQTAVEKMEERIGELVSLSSYYKTTPEDFPSDNMFLNAACCIETEFSPFEVLQLTEDIEYGMGRLRKSIDGIYEDRLIDIDILLYEDIILHTSNLKIPHPMIIKRSFVLIPLNEIAPELIHPLYGLTIREIYNVFLKKQ